MRRCPIRARFAAFRQETAGIAAVEFALLLPVLVLLLFGTMEIGRAVSDYQAVAKGVRDASRYVTRVTAVSCTAVGPYTLGGTEATQAKNLAMSGLVTTPAAADLRLPYWDDASTVQVQIDCIDNPVTASGDRTYGGIYTSQAFVPQVTVSADVPLLRLFGDLILSSDTDVFTMSVSHTQLHIGE